MENPHSLPSSSDEGTALASPASVTPDDRLHRYADGDGVHCASIGNIFLTLITGRLSLSGLERIYESSGLLIDKEEKTVSLTISPIGLPMPNAAYRKRSAEIMSERKPSNLANILVLEGEGFWVAAARTVLSGMEMLSRSGATLEVSRDIRAGLDIAAPFLAGTPPPALLLPLTQIFVDEIRADLGTHLVK